jgi:hypothetical protein
MDDFEKALENFRAASEEVLLAHFADNHYTFAVPRVEAAPIRNGAKYAKLWRKEKCTTTGEDMPSTSIHAFVELKTGDIFKPASCKVPAKHARGNIFEDGGRASLTNSGSVRYLR